MSAEERLEEKRRQRALRRQQQAETEAEEAAEEVDDESDEDDDSSSAISITERKGRATPGRRTQEVELTKAEGNFFTRRLRGLREYYLGVRDEINKVVWPTREEAIRLTQIVLVVTIIASIVLGAISLAFNALIAAGLNNPLVVFGGVFVFAVAAFGYYLFRVNRRGSSY